MSYSYQSSISGSKPVQYDYLSPKPPELLNEEREKRVEVPSPSFEENWDAQTQSSTTLSEPLTQESEESFLSVDKLLILEKMFPEALWQEYGFTAPSERLSETDLQNKKEFAENALAILGTFLHQEFPLDLTTLKECALESISDEDLEIIASKIYAFITSPKILSCDFNMYKRALNLSVELRDPVLLNFFLNSPLIDQLSDVNLTNLLSKVEHGTCAKVVEQLLSIRSLCMFNIEDIEEIFLEELDYYTVCDNSKKIVDHIAKSSHFIDFSLEAKESLFFHLLIQEDVIMIKECFDKNFFRVVSKSLYSLCLRTLIHKKKQKSLEFLYRNPAIKKASTSALKKLFFYLIETNDKKNFEMLLSGNKFQEIGTEKINQGFLRALSKSHLQISKIFLSSFLRDELEQENLAYSYLLDLESSEPHHLISEDEIDSICLYEAKLAKSIQAGEERLARELITSGALLELCSESYCNLLLLSAQKSSPYIFHHLVSHPKFNFLDESSFSSLFSSSDILLSPALLLRLFNTSKIERLKSSNYLFIFKNLLESSSDEICLKFLTFSPFKQLGWDESCDLLNHTCIKLQRASLIHPLLVYFAHFENLRMEDFNECLELSKSLSNIGVYNALASCRWDQDLFKRSH